MTDRDDPFYVGYLARSPAPIATRTRSIAVLLLALGMILGTLLVVAQSRFDDGAFEYGVDRDFEGTLVERPYPLLLVPGPDGGPPITHYLVAFGKFGAGRLVEDLDGRPVRVTGSLIHNDRQRMIEVHAVEPLPAGAPAEDPEEPVSLGSMTLTGEIVDSKCHLGGMKPGRGKAHRACAIRCISGGIPPVLRVEDASGDVAYLLLVSSDGRSVNREVLPLVAEPVEITGEVVLEHGNQLTLYADPSTYRLVQR